MDNIFPKIDLTSLTYYLILGYFLCHSQEAIAHRYSGYIGSSKNNTNLGHEVSIENVKAFTVTPSLGPSEVIPPPPQRIALNEYSRLVVGFLVLG